MRIDIARWADVGRFHYVFHIRSEETHEQYFSMRHGRYIGKTRAYKIYHETFIGRAGVLNILGQQAYFTRRQFHIRCSYTIGTKFGSGSFYTGWDALININGRIINKLQ